VAHTARGQGGDVADQGQHDDLERPGTQLAQRVHGPERAAPEPEVLPHDHRRRVQWREDVLDELLR